MPADFSPTLWVMGIAGTMITGGALMTFRASARRVDALEDRERDRVTEEAKLTEKVDALGKRTERIEEKLDRALERL